MGRQCLVGWRKSGKPREWLVVDEAPDAFGARKSTTMRDRSAVRPSDPKLDGRTLEKHRNKVAPPADPEPGTSGGRSFIRTPESGSTAPGRVGEPRPRAAGAAHKNLMPPWFQRPPAATTNKPLHQTPFGRW